jgi:GNAT superfamily N-acetyltransferase
MSLSVPFSLHPCTAGDAAELAALHTAVAYHLTQRHDRGPWSSGTTEKEVRHYLRTSRVFAARDDAEIIGTLRLTTRKPWAIDTSYFSACDRPVYLLGMAVTPLKQGRGIGRWCLSEAERIAKAWPADAIRLDAYDAEAGAGRFYASCGWTEVGRAVYLGVPRIYYEILLA